MSVLCGPAPSLRTSQDRGLHRLAGTTSVAGSPDVAQPSAPVLLLRGVADTSTIRRSISDDAGVWSIDRIARRAAGDGYAVLALDPTGTYDPVAKAGLVPSPMPPDPAEHT